MPSLVEQVGPLLESMASVYPPEMSGGFGGCVAGITDLYREMGNVVAGSGTFDGSGLRFTYYFQPRTPEAVVDAYSALIDSTDAAAFGLPASDPLSREVLGLPVTEFRFSLPVADEQAGVGAASQGGMAELARAIYGAEPRLAFLQGKTASAIVFGGDEAYLQRAAHRLTDEPADPSPALARAIAACSNASPAFVGSSDLSSLARDAANALSTLTGEVPPELARLAELKLPMLVYFAVSGRTWKSGWSFDVAQLKRFAEAASGS
jgi:hypothetical protein